MSVWTLIVERNSHRKTNFPKLRVHQGTLEVHVMYGPPDSDLAWSQALIFLDREVNLSEPEYRLVGMMKGDFETNFYTEPEENDENSSI
jgi:hypothetical protein